MLRRLNKWGVRSFVIVSALVSGLGACSEHPAAPVTIAAIEFSVAGNSAQITGLNKTLSLTAQARDTKGQIASVPLQWTVDDASVLSVSSATGPTVTLTAIKQGKTNVRATGGGKSNVLEVTVALGVQTISVNAPTLALTETDTGRVSATVAADPGLATTVTWQSSNPSVMRLVSTSSASGTQISAVAVAPGSAQLTATSTADASKSATVAVTVNAATIANMSVSVDVPKLAKIGDTTRVTVSIRDARGRNLQRTVTWTVDARVATISTSGLLTAVGNGESSLIARLDATWSAGTNVQVGTVFIAIASGAEHTCGIAPDLTTWCWGSNDKGQLGNGTLGGTQTRPVRVAGFAQFAEIKAGQYHTCGRTFSGEIYCWGDNTLGQLGIGFEAQRLSPTKVVSALTFTSLSVGKGHTCATATAPGAIRNTYCWGANGVRQLGANEIFNMAVPTEVVAPRRFASISAGGAHTCGLEDDLMVLDCWGLNDRGQIGVGNRTQVDLPRGLPIFGFALISAGDSHTCATQLSTNTLYCWGSLLSGDQLTPQLVLGAPRFIQLSSGVNFTCGTDDAKSAWCFGVGTLGQLGDGLNRDAAPVKPSLPAGVTIAEVAAGARHACARTTFSAVYCWGSNASGQLGRGNTNSSSTPVLVP
jgi:alpha-tubulin suppressor-like RCC1 family protein